MSINEQLKQLYYSKISDLISFAEDIKNNPSDKKTRVEGPLLMHCWEESYLSAKKKILFVGQETHGWEPLCKNPDEAFIDKLLDCYKKTKLYWSYRGPSGYVPFMKEINKSINNSDDYTTIIQTNVLKFGKNGIGSPNFNVIKAEEKYFNILEDEIKILKPDVIIFISGPDYDNHIKQRLKGVEYEKACEKFNERTLAKLVAPFLPHHTYRTYHPNYLRRVKNKKNYKEIIPEIINMINS